MQRDEDLMLSKRDVNRHDVERKGEGVESEFLILILYGRRLTNAFPLSAVTTDNYLKIYGLNGVV